jgi:uncharacterized protein (TIGR00299 family) protein
VSDVHIHVDMLGGLAGDMFLAAALDAGLCEPEPIERALSGLGFGEVAIDRECTRRGAIEGTHVTFSGWDEEYESTHRHLSTIESLLEESELEHTVRDRAISMFRTLGEAESTIHGIPLENVHFHEVGALDSIFDFVAAAWLLEHTADSWSWGPVPTGSGTVETDHGTVPVPVPATARLLKGFRTRTSDAEAELVTPTGATILSTLREISPENRRLDGRVAASGYGAGTREVDGLSNVVRLLALETDSAEKGTAPEPERDEVVRLVAEIDDMQPELLADAAEGLYEAGALDVVREPVQMKKGRQGVRLSVLARPSDEPELAAEIFERTTTFGLRVERTARRKLARHTDGVETRYGTVAVKVGKRDGSVLQVSPEFGDCRRLAREADVSTGRVYKAARASIEAAEW